MRNFKVITFTLLVTVISLLIPYSLYSDELSTLAVLDFSYTTLSVAEANLIIDYLGTHITETERFRVIDRTNRENILNEQEFSLNNCSDQNCQIEAGKLLSADLIIVGSIGKVGNTFIFNIRLVDVATSETIKSVSQAYETIDAIVSNCKNIAAKIAGTEVFDTSIENSIFDFTIIVNPPQSRIFFNDTLIGTGPKVMLKTTTGKHSIQVELDSYYTHKTTVQIGSAFPDFVELSLREKGSIKRVLFWGAIGSSIATIGTGGYTYYQWDQYKNSSIENVDDNYASANNAFIVLQATTICSAITWIAYFFSRSF